METFTPFPVDFLTENNTLNDDDPYFSLSQFDFELQQQAQAALQQDSWQDFDKYLSLDSNQLINQQQQQQQQLFNDPNLFYAPLNEIMPMDQKAAIDQPNPLNDDWKENIKQEYNTPESLPFSPLQQDENTTSSTDPTNQSPKLTTDSTTPSTATTTATSTIAPPNIDFMGWNSNGSSLEPQGKIPIQRLKTLNSINNSVNTSASNSSSVNAPGRQHKKTAHNAIERRYRNNINDRIAELKNAVPALLYAKVKDNNGRKRKNDEEDDGEDGEEYLDGVAVATKLNKATILRKATEYINHLKKTGEDIKRENEVLQNILSQLPGGADILQRYHMQKQQREKELQRQQLLERELQKQQEQQRKAANRKRARYNRNIHDASDEYESSSSSPDPATPPAMTSRVFMAMFMAITFLSTSPLTTNTTPAEHHHVSRTPTAPVKEDLNAPVLSTSIFTSLFQFDSTWSMIRTVMFVICLLQLFLPYIRSFFFGSSLKLKRVNPARRLASNYVHRKEVNNVTPGDLKCRQMYSILNQSGRLLPRDTIVTIFCLLKETLRLFAHHVLGYDILYGDHDLLTPEEEWGQVCKWIKLNETLCLGGSGHVSRLSMLYACFHMINLVDLLDEDKHDHVYQTHARAYATAAMQMTIAIPRRALADRLSNYFWKHAIYHIQKNDQDLGFEESNQWMLSLTWLDPEQEHESIRSMPETRVWAEAIEMFSNQTRLSSKRNGLSISYTAPVLVPAAILSTLHLLDNLRIQFDRLVTLMATTEDNTNSDDEFDDDNGSKISDVIETEFSNIMLLTESSDKKEEASTDQQRLAYWFAAVGATTEALWKNKMDQVEKWLPHLIQRVPRSMTSRGSSVAQKATLNQLDELIKKAMIHTLVGSALLKDNDVEKQKQGLAELKSAESLRTTIRKQQSKMTSYSATSEDGHDLESIVLSLADFVVSFAGLEAWITAMKLNQDVAEVEDHVRESTLALRRMIRHPYLQMLGENQSIVDRLTRLGRFITHHPGDTDSACDITDEDNVVDAEDSSAHQIVVKRAEKAQSILHGLI
ncbi:hypothetical protein CU097_015208 [Rhizopus azygosporus]|uniref:BHLH domain-containing protein n=2 Tax=Rhizopus TaxID=4842 RepID=A0A367KFT8_RHIAZ|nr:hypothetical protein CU097_015208 [Rhizopus azygosporus]